MEKPLSFKTIRIAEKKATNGVLKNCKRTNSSV